MQPRIHLPLLALALVLAQGAGVPARSEEPGTPPSAPRASARRACAGTCSTRAARA